MPGADPLSALALNAGSTFMSGFLGRPDQLSSRAETFGVMSAPFLVGGEAIKNADPISRTANNLMPVLLIGVALWVVLGSSK